MKIDFKPGLKNWIIYFTTIILSVYVHELGHSVYVWAHGYRAFPTPAKNYVIDTIPENLQQYVSLGGIVGSVLFVLIIFSLYVYKSFKYNSVILAAAIVAPGMYTLRFILAGRGHDSTEFQEAQSALGLNYSGHLLDWLFLVLFLTGIILWIIKSKPTFKITGRLIIGVILTIIFFIVLQYLNNAIFDPMFKS